ncbi:MAG: AMP-binding protein [Thermoanaerobaculaceae bacterium]|nr:AMP-binding protein [Thermoanaerobaculaceae bacterium]
MNEIHCPLVRAFHRLARRAPQAPALLGPDGTVVARRGELAAAAAALAGTLAEHIQPGATVALSLPNAGGLVPAFLALRELGARVALVDAAAPMHELARCAATVGAQTILASQERLAQLGVVWSDGLLALAVGPPLEAVVLPPGTAVLKLTSGSTGQPRAVAVTARQLVADTVKIMHTMGVRPQDVTMAAIPMTHSYGLGSCLVPALLAGTPLALPSSALPGALAHTLAAARVAHFPAVPAMIRAVATLATPETTASLRVCLAAGAPLLPADAEAFHRATGHPVHVFYGSSECGGITYDRREEPRPSAGCVGTAMEGVVVEVVDEAGHPQPPGTEGRVLVRSRSVAAGTVPPSDPAILSPGRFLTGDRGVLDEAGQLTLSGRVADLLNVAGKKVHPDEVRRVLEALPGVTAAAVLGLPDPHRGELVAAVVAVEPGAGLTVRAVLSACRQRLSPHKVPRRIVFVRELPVSERGKVRRDELLRLLNHGSPSEAFP